ncbi:hypothetical protein M758_1G331300 [Ceratodon purpureus]|nr:hypothetical protein M758_1G331300 [Ceratodon purpureus]
MNAPSPRSIAAPRNHKQITKVQKSSSCSSLTSVDRIPQSLHCHNSHKITPGYFESSLGNPQSITKEEEKSALHQPVRQSIKLLVRHTTSPSSSRPKDGEEEAADNSQIVKPSRHKNQLALFSLSRSGPSCFPGLLVSTVPRSPRSESSKSMDSMNRN